MTPHAGAQDQVDEDKPNVFTMRQLNQRTAFVIDQVIKKGPALITRLGRFAVVITPLEQDLESRVLSQLAREISQPGLEVSSQVSEQKPEVYTIRQLGQQTAFIIDQIEKNGPALITRNGHFVVMIRPLLGDVEARVLSEMAREIDQLGPGASA
jgi:antitoxin (DNA-binding transcriptional repressor) of toxin-antitoxin stability system